MGACSVGALNPALSAGPGYGGVGGAPFVANRRNWPSSHPHFHR
jgi:hypothetical protein